MPVIKPSVTDFPLGCVSLHSCAFTELNCSARDSGVNWKVTCEIGCDGEPVNSLHDLESLLVAITEIFGVEGGKGREMLPWLGLRGRSCSAFQQDQPFEVLWLRDTPPVPSPGKHRLSSSFQPHESGVICELARVLHNGDVCYHGPCHRRWSPEQRQWWWRWPWRGNEGKSYPNLEVLLSPAEIQM